MSKMKNTAKEMMERLGMGLKGTTQMKMAGPISDAVDLCLMAIASAHSRGQLDQSPTLQAVKVLIDHVRKVRDALEVAVKLVDLVEADGAMTPARAKEIAGTIASFKLMAVRARLHQKLPPKED